MGDNLESSGDEGVCNTLRFRCLFITRAAVALVVTVLTAIVVFKAVDLILHPNKLQLTVFPSDVYVRKLEEPRVEADGRSYEYIFMFYLEAKNPSESDFIYYSNITIRLKQAEDNMWIANFSLTSSMPLSQQEEQEYLVYGYADADDHQVNTDLLDSKIFKNDTEATKQQKIGAVMTLDGIIRVEGTTNLYRRATYDCESVGVGRTLPWPSSSDANKGKCGRAIL